jgi:hypothetical protein
MAPLRLPLSYLAWLDIDRKAAAFLVVDGRGAAESKCGVPGSCCVSRAHRSASLVADAFQQYSVGARTMQS